MVCDCGLNDRNGTLACLAVFEALLSGAGILLLLQMLLLSPLLLCLNNETKFKAASCSSFEMLFSRSRELEPIFSLRFGMHGSPLPFPVSFAVQVLDLLDDALQL